MPKAKRKKDDRSTQPEPLSVPEPLPLIVPVLPSDPFIPIPLDENPPEPIEAPPDPNGRQPIDETPNDSKTQV
jgi:hypothetical protein